MAHILSLEERISLKFYKIWCSVMIKVLNLVESFYRKIYKKDLRLDKALDEIREYRTKYKLAKFASGSVDKVDQFVNKTSKFVKNVFGESNDDLNFKFSFSLPDILKMIIDGIKIINHFKVMAKALPPGEEKEEAQQVLKDTIQEIKKTLPQIKIPGIQKAMIMLPEPKDDIKITPTLKEEIIELSRK